MDLTLHLETSQIMMLVAAALILIGGIGLLHARIFIPKRKRLHQGELNELEVQKQQLQNKFDNLTKAKAEQESELLRIRRDNVSLRAEKEELERNAESPLWLSRRLSAALESESGSNKCQFCGSDYEADGHPKDTRFHDCPGELAREIREFLEEAQEHTDEAVEETPGKRFLKEESHAVQ